MTPTERFPYDADAMQVEERLRDDTHELADKIASFDFLGPLGSNDLFCHRVT